MRIKLKPIKDQVVVVVGASSGMGRLAAKVFASQGAKLVVAARGQEGLDSLKEEIVQLLGKKQAHVKVVVTDVSNNKQVEKLADAAVREYGRIDTWVQLAAVSIYAKFEDTEPDEFQQIIDVNLVGQAYGAMAALPHLRKHGGALIMISSVESQVALPYQSAYAASKHGMKGMIDALRLELEHDKVPVSVTNIMPSSINTPFFNQARTKLGVKPRGVAPMYDPRSVVAAIVHAAEKPMRDVIVGDAGALFVAGKKFAPALTNTLLKANAFSGQETDEKKSNRAPDNMFKPLNSNDRVDGDFSEEAVPPPASDLRRGGGFMGWILTALAGVGIWLFLRREEA